MQEQVKGTNIAKYLSLFWIHFKYIITITIYINI